MAFSYTSGNPNNLVGGQPAAMVDIRGPFLDLSTYLNSLPAPAAGPSTALSNITVSEVGISGQVRAGRQLASTDFTNQGLSVPIALWNLGGLTDASGNGRTLVNKGSVPFGVGINGSASTAATFAGSTGQALYIADTGAADPFRIRTGSWGCWFRTAKRGTLQTPMGKRGASPNNGWSLRVTASNVADALYSGDGSTIATISGTTDVCDDRWHHAVVTHDASRMRLYVDGVLEAQITVTAVIFGTPAAFNVGAWAADGSTAASEPFYGRVDEAFVTADVLSDDQVRNLYAARVTHSLGSVPGDVRLLVRRKRRGGALVTTDFPSTPVRLHNFTAGALTDAGSGGVALTSNPGTGAIVAVADADGSSGGAYSFSGAHAGLSSTDAGLPSGTAARSYGEWFKTTSTAGGTLAGWGTQGTADARLLLSATAASTIQAFSAADGAVGPVVNDGLWHHAVVVEDNAAGDGVKRKLYLDGRLVAGSTVLNSLTLAGANKFRIGMNPDGTTGPFVGQLDDAFVYSGALTAEQVRTVYNKGSQALAPSPKDATDHVEAVTSTDLLAVFDSIEASDAVDLIVSP